MLSRNVMLIAGTICLGLLVSFYLLYPTEVMAASLRGIAIWWDVLFPALLPFLVLSEIFLGIGIVHAIGSLLDPVMRPLFRVSGKGGFVMAIGFAAGYPVAAKLTSGLRKHNWISREEGERLVSFATTSDPVFLLSAVAIGFFHNPSLAIVLGIAHYGGAVIVGLLMRFHALKTPLREQETAHEKSEFIFIKALRAMHRARIQDGRTFSILLRDAIQSSLQLLFVVGGLVVFFSVLMEIFQLISLTGFITLMITVFLQTVHLPEQLASALTVGLFEVTLGAKASAIAGTSNLFKACAAALILSWSGLSVHAQVVSLVQQDQIRYFPFLIARILHSFIAVCLVLVLWNPLQPFILSWAPELNAWKPADTFIPLQYGTSAVYLGFVLFAAMTGLLIIASLFIYVWKRCTH